MSPELIESPVTFACVMFAAVGTLLLVSALQAVGSMGPVRLGLRLIGGLAALGIGVVAGILTLGLQGYQIFTKEVVAAKVSLQPLAAQQYKATLRFPDGRTQHYQVAGDEVYIDGHIIKWQPYANLLGLHTSFELDRLGGRYTSIEHEKTRERTIHPLGRDKPINLVSLRNRYEFLQPLIDAQYGSATFMPLTGPADFEIRVSTSGLLMRKL